MIEVRIRVPGGNNWVVHDVKELLKEQRVIEIYVVQTEPEKQYMDGVCMVLGSDVKVVVGKHTLAPTIDEPYLFLWVVEVSDLS